MFYVCIINSDIHLFFRLAEYIRIFVQTLSAYRIYLDIRSSFSGLKNKFRYSFEFLWLTEYIQIFIRVFWLAEYIRIFVWVFLACRMYSDIRSSFSGLLNVFGYSFEIKTSNRYSLLCLGSSQAEYAVLSVYNRKPSTSSLKT